MDCLRPITLKNGDLVPCGDCPRCRRNRQRDWEFRLKAERDSSDFTLWLTLTISDEYMEFQHGFKVLSRDMPRHFFEALRKHYGKSLFIKHYLVSEYGDETDRPHFHCLLFCNVPGASFNDVLKMKKDLVNYICHDKFAWPYGFAFNKSLHNHVFSYITNYVNKPEIISDVPHPVRPFTCISNGIGLSMLENIDTQRIEKDLSMVINYNGGKKALPRYYREKILPTSLTSIRKALKAGDVEEAQRIYDNAQRLKSFLENYVYPKKVADASRKMREFEKDHTISYADYLKGCRSHELQEYKQQLKKRKNL